MRRKISAAIMVVVMVCCTIFSIIYAAQMAEVSESTQAVEAVNADADISVTAESGDSDLSTSEYIGIKEIQYETNLSPAYAARNTEEESVSSQTGALTLTQTDYSIPLTNGSFEIKRIFSSAAACKDYKLTTSTLTGQESFYTQAYHLADGWRFSFPMLEITTNDWGNLEDGDEIENIMFHSESGAVYSMSPAITEENGSITALTFTAGNHGLADFELAADYENGSTYITGFTAIDRSKGVTYKFNTSGQIVKMIYNNGEYFDDDDNNCADVVDFTYGASNLLSKITVKVAWSNAQEIEFGYTKDENGDELVDSITLPNGKKIEYSYKVSSASSTSTDALNNNVTMLTEVKDIDGNRKYKFNSEAVSVKRTYAARTVEVSMVKLEDILYCRKNKISHYEYETVAKKSNLTTWESPAVSMHQDYELVNSIEEATENEEDTDDTVSEITSYFGCSIKKIGAETDYDYPTDIATHDSEGIYTEKFDYNMSNWELFATGDTRGSFVFMDGYMYSWRRMHSECLLSIDGEETIYKDFVLDTTITLMREPITDYTSAGVIFDVKDFGSGNNNFTGYYARISPDSDNESNESTIALFKMKASDDGTADIQPVQTLAKVTFDKAGLGTNCRENQAYHMRIEKEDKIIKVYVVNMSTPVITYEEKDESGTYCSGGYVGLRTFQRRAAYTSFSIAESGYTYTTTIAEKGEVDREITNTYDYYENLVQQDTVGKNHMTSVYYEYDSNRMPKQISTEQYEISTDDSGNTKYLLEMKKSESYKYDEYGNLTEYKSPLADRTGQQSEDDGQVEELSGETVRYTYDTVWGVPTSKTVMKDDDTVIYTKYTIDDDTHTKITQEDIYINGAILRSASYTYDSYGRMEQKCEIENNVANTITYSYTNPEKDTGTSYTVTKTVALGDDDDDDNKIVTSMTTSIYNGNVCSTQEIIGTDTTSHKTDYTYDDAERLSSITYPDKTTVAYTYTMSRVDENGVDYSPIETTIKYNDGVYSTLRYDAYGRVTETTIANASDSSESTRRYDSDGNIVEITDGNGNVTSYEYDDLNRLVTKSVFAAGESTSSYNEAYAYSYKTLSLNGTEYDVAITLVKYDDGTIEGVGYDMKGREIIRENECVDTTITAYDYVDNVVAVEDGNGNTTNFEYDGLNRLTKAVYPNGDATEYAYNVFDLLVSKTEGDAVNEYFYDAAGRLTAEITHLNQENSGYYTAYQYNLLNDVTLIAKGTYLTSEGLDEIKNGEYVNISEKEAYEYNVRHRLIAKTTDMGYRVEYEYDCRGNVLTEKECVVADTYLNIITREYDFAGRCVSESVSHTDNGVITDDDVVTKTEYTYDKNGNLTDKKSGGLTESYTYNAINSPLTKTTTSGLTESYCYDGKGNLISAEYLRETVEVKQSYEYDAAGRIVSETDAVGNVTKYTYDRNGNVTKLTKPDGSHITYTYDARNRLVKTSALLNGEECAVSETEYDPRGNVVKETRGKISTTQEYDAANNVVKVTNGEGDSVLYEYDGSGRVVKTTDANGNVTIVVYYTNGMPKTITFADNKSIIYPSTDYDSAGKYMITTRDRMDNATVVQYNIFGKPETITYADGETESYVYDSLGRMTEYVNREKTKTMYTYDNGGNVTKEEIFASETQEPARERSYTYSIDGLLLTATDGEDNTTEYTYDAAGNVTNITYFNNATDSFIKVTDSFVYEDGRLFSETRNGVTTQYTYDVFDRVISQTTGERTICYKYDAAGNVTSMTDAEGGEAVYEYDASGRLTTERVKRSGTDYDVTEYEYDANGNVTTVTMNTTPVSVTAYKYDVFNDVTEVDNNGSVTGYVYDDLQRVTAVDVCGDVNEYAYDVMGNMYAEKDAAGKITLYTYDVMGRLLSSADCISDEKMIELEWSGIVEYNEYAKAMTYTYDIFGNVLTETNAKGYTLTYTYDDCDRVKTVTMPDETVSAIYAYDAAGNVTSVTEAMGNTTQYSYENNRIVKEWNTELYAKIYSYNEYGELASETDGEGNVTSYTYDNCGRLTEVVMSEEVTAKYSYDNAGNLLTQTDGEGHVTTYAYYAFGYVLSVTDADGSATSYEYDARGNVTKETDGNGAEIYYTYDATNNLQSVETDDTIILYTYNALNQRTTMDDASGQYVYTYDAGNRLTEIKKDNESYVKYEYDVLGNVTAINDTVYEYDECNRMTAAGEVKYTYDENGNLASTTYGVGQTKYAYDKRNRVTSVVNKVGENIVSSYEYAYYKNDLEYSKKDNIGKETCYSYDGAGRLIKTTDGDRTTTYTYDKAGNRTELVESYTEERSETLGGEDVAYITKTTTYIYTDGNRLTSVASIYTGEGEVMRTVERYVYDGAGREVSSTVEYLTPISEESSTTEDDTTEAVGIGYDSVVVVTINEYNGLGQLANTTNIAEGERSFAEYVYNGDGLRVKKTVDGEATDYVYSGDYVIAETGKIYLRGLSYHAVKTSEGTFYYYANAHGDITAIVNGNEEVIATYEYDEFGNITAQSGDFENDIRYTGEFFDDESGNYYLRARYYDPTTGRFISADTHWTPENMIYGDSEESEEQREKRAADFKYYIPVEQSIGKSSAPQEIVKNYSAEAVIEALVGNQHSYANITYAGIMLAEIVPERLTRQVFVMRNTNSGAIVQSSNLYVYCGNNPVMFVDSNGKYELYADNYGKMYLVVEEGDTLESISKGLTGTEKNAPYIKVDDEGVTVGEIIEITSLIDNPPEPPDDDPKDEYIYPLTTKHTRDPQTGNRNFGAPRNNGARLHAGIDLVAPKGTGVVAMTGGTVVEYSANFYAGTSAVVVQNDDGSTVVYGEIQSDLKVGDKVSQGDVIGTVIPNNDSGSSMLHIEYYSGEESGTVFANSNAYKRRADIQDPTFIQYLTMKK